MYATRIFLIQATMTDGCYKKHKMLHAVNAVIMGVTQLLCMQLMIPDMSTSRHTTTHTLLQAHIQRPTYLYVFFFCKKDNKGKKRLHGKKLQS